MSGTEPVDVVVVGGGAAGLSGALTLARARRRVVVVDAGEPRNGPADEVHGFLTREGAHPADLLRSGRAEVERHGGEILHGTAAAARRAGDGFEVELADGRTLRARRLLVATGLIDELPDLPGLPERWGREVVHCPYCHGWELRDRRIAVIARGELSVHQALLWRQWSPDVTLFHHTAAPLTADEREQLDARGIAVVPGEVVRLERAGGGLTAVVLEDGARHPVDAIAVATRLTARGAVLEGLGIEAVEHATRVGTHLESDDGGTTPIPGVWLAGNVTDLFAQVVVAAADGMRAAAGINDDLIAEDVARARAAVTRAPSEDR